MLLMPLRTTITFSRLAAKRIAQEGLFWSPAPLEGESERSFKVRAAEDVQAPPPELLENYLSDSSVGGSDDEDPPAVSSAPMTRRTR